MRTLRRVKTPNESPRRGAHLRPRLTGTDDVAGPERPEERHRRAGGPEDAALYTCDCGMAFDAAVSASVRCPHCGDAQAW